MVRCTAARSPSPLTPSLAPACEPPCPDRAAVVREVYVQHGSGWQQLVQNVAAFRPADVAWRFVDEQVRVSDVVLVHVARGVALDVGPGSGQAGAWASGKVLDQPLPGPVLAADQRHFSISGVEDALDLAAVV